MINITDNASITLDELKARKQWIVHRNKTPYQGINPDNPKWNDPEVWVTYAQAQAACKRDRTLSGVGVVLANGIAGCDLDHCRDTTTGTMEQWSRPFIKILDSYSEKSFSGDGVHIICQGSISRAFKMKEIINGHEAGIEIYSEGRYFTFTGNELENTPGVIMPRQEELTQVFDIANALKMRLEEARRQQEPQKEPAPLRTSEIPSPYATKALENECRAINNAVKGRRNDQLNASAYAIGQLVASGAIDRHFAEQSLADAAIDAGLGTIETANTIKSGLEKGMLKPREIKIVPPLANKQAKNNAPVSGEGMEEEEERETLAEKLRRMALQEATFFHTPGGEMYAIINRKGHTETIPLGGRGGPFKRWLLHIYAQATGGKIPNATAVSAAIDSLEAYAENEGDTKEVYLRIAHHNGKIYLNLANDAMQVVEIDETGWRILDTSPVCFRQAAGMLPLPAPARGGNLKDLPRFINLHSDNDDSLLVLAWVIGFFLPNGAYPILNVHGERGAAKSTASRFLRGLVDPHQAALRKAPEDARSLAIMGHNNAIVTLDNLSHISGELSDGLCCLSTGAGDAYRTLYTDNEETIFALKRPIILNGIEEVVTRGDLLDRSITINLPEIDETQRKPERLYWQEVEQAHPRLLGAILDAVCTALRNLPSIELDQLPRMADFALWVSACELCFSDRQGRFMEAYQSNRANAVSVELEASPLATAIEKLMEEQDKWESTTNDLLAKLKKLASDEDSNSKAWPINARSLSGKLKRLATSFRSQGINIHQGRNNKASTVTLQKINSASVANSSKSVANACKSVANEGAGVAKKSLCYTASDQEEASSSKNSVESVANDANFSSPTLPATQRGKEREEEGKEKEERKCQNFATLATPATPRYEEVF